MAATDLALVCKRWRQIIRDPMRQIRRGCRNVLLFGYLIDMTQAIVTYVGHMSPANAALDATVASIIPVDALQLFQAHVPQSYNTACWIVVSTQTLMVAQLRPFGRLIGKFQLREICKGQKLPRWKKVHVILGRKLIACYTSRGLLALFSLEESGRGTKTAFIQWGNLLDIAVLANGSGTRLQFVSLVGRKVFASLVDSRRVVTTLVIDPMTPFEQQKMGICPGSVPLPPPPPHWTDRNRTFPWPVELDIIWASEGVASRSPLHLQDFGSHNLFSDSKTWYYHSTPFEWLDRMPDIFPGRLCDIQISHETILTSSGALLDRQSGETILGPPPAGFWLCRCLRDDRTGSIALRLLIRAPQQRRHLEDPSVRVDVEPLMNQDLQESRFNLKMCKSSLRDLSGPQTALPSFAFALYGRTLFAGPTHIGSNSQCAIRAVRLPLPGHRKRTLWEMALPWERCLCADHTWRLSFMIHDPLLMVLAYPTMNSSLAGRSYPLLFFVEMRTGKMVSRVYHLNFTRDADRIEKCTLM